VSNLLRWQRHAPAVQRGESGCDFYELRMAVILRKKSKSRRELFPEKLAQKSRKSLLQNLTFFSLPPLPTLLSVK
jgi:hypothetical protein